MYLYEQVFVVVFFLYIHLSEIKTMNPNPWLSLDSVSVKRPHASVKY